MNEYDQIMEQVLEVARRAGEQIMKVCAGELEVSVKSDNSPVTQADMASHHAINSGLKSFSPLPVLSEEAAGVGYATRQGWSEYWLIDALDGTRDFINGHDSFSINIALVKNHEAVLGVVYIPAQRKAYFAARGYGAFSEDDKGQRQPLRVSRYQPDQPMRIAVSRSHPGEMLGVFLEAMGEYTATPLGSALKMCLVASGEVDFYPRLGPTWEWDTAAAQCVVEQAGGSLTDIQMVPFQYNRKEDLRNPHFLVMGDLTAAGMERVRHAIAVAQQYADAKK